MRARPQAPPHLFHTCSEQLNEYPLEADELSVSVSRANGFGFVVPHMGLYMRRVTGSWMPHLLFGAALKVLSGVYFMRYASDRTARELLEKSRAAEEE